jgi:hypothetical protein
MSWLQQIILWAAVPLSIMLIVTIIEVLRALPKALKSGTEMVAKKQSSG